MYIPGNPAVVVKNMQGAGSALAANHIFNVSPRDGSEIGLFAGNIVVDPVIGGVPAKYDARRFGWIGAPASETSICLASPASAFRTIDDTFTREMITGTAGTSTYDFPVVLNNVLGTRLKLVKGYAGSAALRLAMERREIDGFCGVGLSSMRAAGLPSARRIAKSCAWCWAGPTSSGRWRSRPERPPSGLRRCAQALQRPCRTRVSRPRPKARDLRSPPCPDRRLQASSMTFTGRRPHSPPRPQPGSAAARRNRPEAFPFRAKLSIDTRTPP
jgi:hypothetical protein